MKRLLALVLALLVTTAAATTPTTPGVHIGDGTNNAAIKGSSSTPGASDPALAVTLSPNSATITTTPGAAIIPAAVVMQNAAVASGNGTNLPVSGYPVALLNIVSSPSMSGGTTVNFEASVDDVTWVAIAAHTIGVNGALVNTTTTDGDFRIATAGYKDVRARISGYSAGTVTIKGYVSEVASGQTAVALGAGTNTIGSIANTGFNVTGTLPAFAATPTFNLGTNAALVAGSALIGKVGIDQTTPGSTNAVAATNLPTTVDTNSGTKSAGTLRVVLATDQPALTNKLLVTPDSVALPANQSVNVAQVNGVTTTMGAGASGTGVQRVAPALDALAIAPSASSAAESCHAIKGSAGTLYGVSGYAGQAEWIMLFNATSAPGDGAVTPVWWGYTGMAGAWSAQFWNPLTMGTGITICYSSTGPLTKTAISTNNVFEWESN